MSGHRGGPVQRGGAEVRRQDRVADRADFGTIITGVQGKKYDIGVSSFTINDERKQQVTMVSYFNAGTQWATAKGNPKGVDPDNACGKTVAVQSQHRARHRRPASPAEGSAAPTRSTS